MTKEFNLSDMKFALYERLRRGFITIESFIVESHRLDKEFIQRLKDAHKDSSCNHRGCGNPLTIKFEGENKQVEAYCGVMNIICKSCQNKNPKVYIERAGKLDREGIRAVCGTDKEYSDYVKKIGTCICGHNHHCGACKDYHAPVQHWECRMCKCKKFEVRK